MVNKNAFAVIGVLAVIPIGLGLVVFASDGDMQGERKIQTSPESAPKTRERKRPELASNVRALNRRLQVLERRSAESVLKEADDAPEQVATEPSGAEIAGEEPSPEEILKQRDEVLARVQEVSREFEYETLDEEWAPEMEDRIATVLSAAALSDKTEVLSTACRSSTCRIEARHEDRKSRQAFALVARNIPGSYYLQEIDPEDARGDGTLRTVAFFIRRDHERESPVYEMMYSE